MDCIALTTFFTFLLALFGLLQWLAINKQNKQNLFKLRLEHYMKFKTVMVDATINADKVQESNNGSYNSKLIIKALKDVSHQLEKLIPESAYLFSKEYSDEEKKIVESINIIIDLLIQNPEVLPKQLNQTIILSADKTWDEAEAKIDSLINKFIKL